MRRVGIIIAFAVSLLAVDASKAQLHEDKYNGVIYQEKDVPKYSLPEIMKHFDGKEVKTVDDWEKTRRPEIIDFFAENMYGKVPTPSDPIVETFELISEDPEHMEGLCTKREVRITLKNKFGKVSLPLILFVPNSAQKPVPAIYLFNGDDIRRRRLELDGPQSYGKTKNGIPLKQLMLREIGAVTIDGKAFGRDYRNKEGKVSGGIVDLFIEPGQKYTIKNRKGEFIQKTAGADGRKIKEKTFIGNSTLGYIMPAERSLDIDTEMDFRIGEFLMNQTHISV